MTFSELPRKEGTGLGPRASVSSPLEMVNCQPQAASSPALIGLISGGCAGATAAPGQARAVQSSRGILPR